MNSWSNRVLVRHIQDYDAPNSTLEPHWGYPSRVLPCTSDKGTCEYLKAVYWMHDTSMKYSFILWGVLLGILVVWVAIRGWRMGGPAQSIGSALDRACDQLLQLRRRWLLGDAPIRWLFGRVSRLQVLILACLLVYLLIFSLAGIVFKTWITPVEDYPKLYNTRTGLGGFSDRVGVFAFSLTPFTILLSHRESCLSLFTGIPYQHFSFLHRWTGRIIFVQSFLHTLGWTIVEGKLYQPQPAVYVRLMSEMYIIFGVVAMFLLTLMVLLSTQTAIKWLGYEFFKITHWIIAILYIGACWGHWDRLWCWMVASLALIAIDQTLRVLRMCYIHMGSRAGHSGFRAAQANVQVFGQDDDRVIRLDFEYDKPWKAGQHFHLCFPSLSIWQSHPFTPSSLPNPSSRLQHHTYLIRLRTGQTAELVKHENCRLSVILTGPYGKGHPRYATENVLAVAGGTAVSFTLPVTLELMRQTIVPRAAVDFVWIVRRTQDLLWLTSELSQLKAMLKESPGLRIDIFVTRENEPIWRTGAPIEDKSAFEIHSSRCPETQMKELVESTDSRFTVKFLHDRRPAISDIVTDFMERSAIRGGNVEIVGSGSEELGSGLRHAVAQARSNEAISFYWDSPE